MVLGMALPVVEASGGDPYRARVGDTQLSEIARDLVRVISAVTRLISLEEIRLPDEFFPAHLPVALIDAVFRSGGEAGDPAPSCAEQYSRHFGFETTRRDQWELPPAEDQETLGRLVRRYEELGTDRMTDEVFGVRQAFSGTNIERAEYVLAAARQLHGNGVNVLQDLSVRSRSEVERILRFSPGFDESTLRRFLMYTGEDDFVWGGEPVREFVANAVGRASIASREAEELVRGAAYELILAPRFLDREIRRYGASPEGIA